MVDEPIAAPSAAPATPDPAPSASDQAVVAKDPIAYKAARHQERFGKSTPEAGSSPAKPVDQAVPSDVKPDVKAAPSADTKRPDPRATENRIPELLAERAQARAEAEQVRKELADLRASLSKSPDVTPAASSAATDDPEPDPTDTTKYPDGQFDLKFLKDNARWEAREERRQHEATAKAAEAKTASERQWAERVSAHEARMSKFAEATTKATEADPKALEGIDPQLYELRPSILLQPGEQPTFGHAVADALLRSSNPVGLMKHLSNREEATRLAQLAPEDFLMEIGRIEGRLTPAEAVTKPAAKTLTDAPAPPTTLGQKPADSADPVESALRDGDFLRYQSAKRARERAALAG